MNSLIKGILIGLLEVYTVFIKGKYSELWRLGGVWDDCMGIYFGKNNNGNV